MDQRKSRLLQRGIDHLQSGNLDAAQASFESLLASEPGNEAARYRLSLIAVRRGQFSRALEIAEPLLDDQTRPEIVVHIARCHIALGRIAAAQALLDRATAAGPRSAVVLSTLAIALSQLGQHARAVTLLDQAIAIEPREPSLYYNRALIRRELHLIDAATKDLEDCLARQPGHAMAHWTLANLRTCGAGFEHVERLQKLLSRLPSGSASEEVLALALFKELDDLERRDEAAPLLRRAIDLRPAVRLPADERRRWFQSLRGLAPGQGEDTDAGDPSLVFVVGMPRAGAELLAQQLGRHPAMQRPPMQCGLLHFLGRQVGREAVVALDADLRDRVATLSPAATAKAFVSSLPPRPAGASHVLFAQPLDFPLVGVIAKYFPRARVLHALRDPADTCLSLLAQPHGQMPPTLAQPPGDSPTAMAEYYRDYTELMRHWHALFPGRILDVPHESLLAKPEMMLRVICAFLGLRYDPALLAGPPLVPRPADRWRRYLAPLGLKPDWPLGARH